MQFENRYALEMRIYLDTFKTSKNYYCSLSVRVIHECSLFKQAQALFNLSITLSNYHERSNHAMISPNHPFTRNPSTYLSLC